MPGSLHRSPVARSSSSSSQKVPDAPIIPRGGNSAMVTGDTTPRSSTRKGKNKRLKLDSSESQGVSIDDVMDELRELKELVVSLVKDNVMLKNELTEMKVLLRCAVPDMSVKSVVPSKSSSFASVVKSSDKVVVINPTQPEQKSDDTRKMLKEKLNAKEFQMRGVSNSRKGGVIVQCASSAERNKLKSVAAAKLGDAFVVSVPAKRNPRVRIYGYTDEYNAVDFLTVLKDQNPQVFTATSVVRIEHLFSVTAKARFGAKLEVDPVTFKMMMDAKKVYIGWDACWVNEDMNIRRCYKCWGFNHVMSKCVAPSPRCPKCSGNHDKTQCTSTVDKCVVCCDAVKNNHLVLDTNHTALDVSCPTYVHRVAMERRAIIYEK